MCFILLFLFLESLERQVGRIRRLLRARLTSLSRTSSETTVPLILNDFKGRQKLRKKIRVRKKTHSVKKGGVKNLKSTFPTFLPSP